MNLPNYTSAAVLGVPIMFVVIGLVQWVKKLGLSGKWLYIASMAIGLLLGGGFVISASGVPTDFTGWFGVSVYGIGLGLSACGLYDAATRIATKARETPL